MKENFDQLSKAKKMLSQVLGVALNSAESNKVVQEAKDHIKKAIVKIDMASDLSSENVVSQDNQWWDDVVANAPFVNITKEQADKAVNQLDAMIDAEKEKISEIDEKNEKDKKDKKEDESNEKQILND